MSKNQESERTSKATRKYTFQWRAYVSLFLFLAGVLLAFSGIILYIAPSGRIAKTIEWRPLGLDKDQWETLHTILGFVVLYFSYLHIRYNWRPIVSYFRRKIGDAMKLRKELALATLTTALLVIGSVYNLPPVRQIMDFGESFNDFWECWGENQGYYVVSEEELHPEDAETSDSSEGGQAETTTRGENTSTSATTSSKGYGRLTVADLAKDEGVAVETAIQRLAEYQVEARPDDNMLTLSGRSGYSPGQLAAIIRGEDPDDYSSE